ncbi:hypothetical protein QTQ03_25550 [Micromonospora sp. WMMA1363]|uniref:hypothetical protein n=1 Tax=Micromonospora sp. WMMA1363 TaxID=3053985 RepID=UPI00259D2A78|nr:hypothetical protein [Micromonospora sp. WMMA1363]MDM4722801.1 hypothetical protein [Micromonospora sp. WMMA1363]
MIRIARHRRFTANHTLHLDIGSRRLFVKINPNRSEAAVEIVGYEQMRSHYPVPALHVHRRIGRWTVTVYDRHQPDQPDTGLLLDAITADGIGARTHLDRGLDAIIGHYRHVISATMRQVPASQTIGKLYRDRAQPGGRLHRYYAHNPTLLTMPDGSGIRCGDLREATLVINGQPRRLDFDALVTDLRTALHPDQQVWAALTQGDPTDFNIGLDGENRAVWFDYDTAGLNALAGEIACFLWYQRLHAAWLVPRYNPGAFTDHQRALADAVKPQLRLARPTARTITIDYQHRPSAPRQHTLARYLAELAQPLASGIGADLPAWLRPYLAMRLLAVYPLQQMESADAALSIGLLADLYAPEVDLTQLLGLVTTPEETMHEA